MITIKNNLVYQNCSNVFTYKIKKNERKIPIQLQKIIFFFILKLKYISILNKLILDCIFFFINYNLKLSFVKIVIIYNILHIFMRIFLNLFYIKNVKFFEYFCFEIKIL